MNSPDLAQARRFSVAPMMNLTDRHCRFFLRLLTRRTLLFTEMVTSAALIRGGAGWLLDFDPAEHPVAAQLGGSDPAELAEAAALAERLGYDEINLNVGCPSDRVQSGRFGACLMAEPETVAVAVAAMKDRVGVPVTVKCRIGIDDQDSEADLTRFAEAAAAAGVDALYVHARKAWLEGLSPAENRDVPPLDYQRVYRLKAHLAPLPVIVNGGIGGLDAARAHLVHADGVMLGRAAYQNARMLLDADRAIFGDDRPPPALGAIRDAMTGYAEAALAGGQPLHRIVRHMLGLAHGQPGARRFRQILTVDAACPGAGPRVIGRAFAVLEGADEMLETA
ncbi:MAG TPA: tRNA dihydrouridine(20/20a) synthase DusA [Devosiaceae bacterium]|nr:tRNA dihydrouridine(20/20a) synthase DusA [Devosiaceae bacterium]